MMSARACNRAIEAENWFTIAGAIIPMTNSAREFPRFALEATVDFTGPGGKSSGRTGNISRGGLAAIVNRPLAPGDETMVRLSLVFDKDTFSEPLDLPARVVWCTQLGKEYQLGISFFPLKSDQRSYLDMFLRYLEEGQAMRDQEDAPEPEDEEPDPFG